MADAVALKTEPPMILWHKPRLIAEITQLHSALDELASMANKHTDENCRMRDESDSWQAEATRTQLENHQLREALAMVTLDRDQLYDAVKVSLESIEKAVRR